MKVDKIYIGTIIDDQLPKYMCLNTNLYIDQQRKKSIMVGSIYSMLRKHQPNLSQMYYDVLSKGKTGVQYIGTVKNNLVLSFPTRRHWRDSTDLMMFRRSCALLYLLIQDNKLAKGVPIYLPIILQNTKYITFQDLIDQASDFLCNCQDVHLIPCVGEI